MKNVVVLGIETSCDETSIAVVNSSRDILMHEVYSQIKLHAEYGGVIPEVAARSHIDILPQMISNAISSSKLYLKEIDAIAVTAGPGLIGGLIVGVMVAKGLASALNKPCIPVNHLEGHALTVRLTDANLEFPYLLLLVSGGHCQILVANGVDNYDMLGETMDDAVGEAFDKVAKMLGLGYPGGPAVESLAQNGNPSAFNFPKAFFKEKHCNFSFSGLKTAVLREIAKSGHSSASLVSVLNVDEINDINKFRANICASFQYAVGIALCDRITKGIEWCHDNQRDITSVVIAGGVAANAYLKNMLVKKCKHYDFNVITPPIGLCTDNAAMIAWVGVEKMRLNHTYDLKFSPRSRWPIARNV